MAKRKPNARYKDREKDGKEKLREVRERKRMSKHETKKEREREDREAEQKRPMTGMGGGREGEGCLWSARARTQGQKGPMNRGEGRREAQGKVRARARTEPAKRRGKMKKDRAT